MTLLIGLGGVWALGTGKVQDASDLIAQQLEEMAATSPTVSDVMDNMEHMVAGGTSVQDAIMWTVLAPLLLMVLRSFNNFIQPYIDTHNAKLRLRDQLEAERQRKELGLEGDNVREK